MLVLAIPIGETVSLIAERVDVEITLAAGPTRLLVNSGGNRQWIIPFPLGGNNFAVIPVGDHTVKLEAQRWQDLNLRIAFDAPKDVRIVRHRIVGRREPAGSME